jgi:hypothetical protein
MRAATAPSDDSLSLTSVRSSALGREEYRGWLQSGCYSCRSRWLNAMRSVSIGPSASHETGHFYFAQTGHSHFAATRRKLNLGGPPTVW